MKYQTVTLTDKQAEEIIDEPGFNLYCENQHGAAYYNQNTGEILWDGYGENNATLLPETVAKYNLKAE